MDDRGYPERLRLASRVTEPAIRRAIGDVGIPLGSSGLDVGCGIGQQTLSLAEAVGPGGVVAGLDLSAANLAVAQTLVGQSPFSSRISFLQGDLSRLPFQDDTFDWVWCADTLWPVAVVGDPIVAVRELARVVRPGGRIAILYWSGQSLLPGYPDLEAHLGAAFTATAPYLRGVPPRRHFLRAAGWLAAAGLERPVARTYVADVQAPLTPELREALSFCLSMLWGGLESWVCREDWELFLRLSDPESDHFILDSPDYYGFVTYTLFGADVPL